MEGPASHGKPQTGLDGQKSVRLAAGKFVLQVGLPDGALVNTAAAEELREPQLRRVPLSELPPRFPFWLDREREIGLAADALQALGPGRFEFEGPSGVGKTALLRCLAEHPLTASFPDGVIYLSAHLQPLPDLLQSLFEVFYESPLPSRPDEAQVSRSLKKPQALILLDDVDLNAQEIYELTGTAMGCTFFLACSERRLWHEGQSLELDGLPTEAAMALFEGCLGRPLADGERAHAFRLAAALQGNPLHIRQAAALSRHSGRSISEISNLQSPVSPSDAIQKQLLETLSEAERLVVFSLAVLDGASAAPDHLAALTALPDIVHTLDGLADRGLVKADAGRYMLAGGLDQRVLSTWDLTEWKLHALVYFTRWADTQPLGSPALQIEIYPLLKLMKWAAGMGRWQEVLRLVRSLEGTLALSGRWEAWRQSLHMGQEAARALGGLSAEAWALHQLGTRLLCLGQSGPARASLIQALRLRQSIGDRAGELATRHNLTLLLDQHPVESERSPAALAPVKVTAAVRPSKGSAPLSLAEAPIRAPAGRSSHPSAKTFPRLSRPLLAGFLLLALILFIPAAYMSWGYFRPVETAGPPTATAYVLVVETPGSLLYLPILPNDYTVPDEPDAVMPGAEGVPTPIPMGTESTSTPASVDDLP